MSGDDSSKQALESVQQEIVQKTDINDESALNDQEPTNDQEADTEQTEYTGSSDHLTLVKLKAIRELEHCNRLYYQGAYEDALAGFQKLVTTLEDQKLLANVGYTLQALGRHQEAIQAFETYLQTFIARHHAWKAMCFSYYHLEDYEQMTRCAREAIRWDIRLDQHDDYSWQQMATAHFLMGDYSTALKAARKASALNPKNAFALYYEACVISALVEGASLDQEGLLEEEASYEQALVLLQQCLNCQPSLAEELRAEGHLDQVFTLFDQAVLEEEQRFLQDQKTSHKTEENTKSSSTESPMNQEK